VRVRRKGAGIDPRIDIKGSIREQRWSGSGGIFYRHPLPYPFKGWLEAGADYVRPYAATVTFYGTQRIDDTSPVVPASRTVTVQQDVPLQLKASLLFNLISAVGGGS
jgi:hypothetical protein